MREMIHMTHVDVVRAWKSDAYRDSLTEDQLAMLPAHPAGIAELSEAELMDANGGLSPAAAAYSFLASAAVSVAASFAGCTGD